MGARRRLWRRRWAAAGAGAAINAGLLGLLTLTPSTRAPEPPAAIVVTLEPLKTAPSRSGPPASGTAPVRPASRRALAPAPVAAETSMTGSPPEAAAAPGPESVEPRWRVDGGAYLDPVTAARARRAWEAAEVRRYRRACLGFSDEHMTDEEKQRCWAGWAAVKPFTR